MESAKVQDSEVGQTADGQPSPTSPGMTIVCTEQSRGQHDPVRRNGGDQVCSGQTTHESEVGEDERSGEGPVHVAQPWDGAVEIVLGVGDMFVVVYNGGPGQIETLAGCEGKVGDEGDGCHEGGQCVEDTLRLE